MTKPTAPVLSATGVHKSYAIGDRKIPVLRGVDLSIQPSEKVALLGASGAGKSTLLHLLGLLDTPTVGEVKVFGKGTSGSSPAERAKIRNVHVGFVFQFYHLIPELTALQNVMLAQMMNASVLSYWGRRKKCKQQAVEMLDHVGLGDRLQHRPSELSGGERQRCAIARALIAEPSIVLADEPTGNLDSQTAEGVIELMFSIQLERQIAFLLVTHDESLARRCDRIIQMKDGVVTEQQQVR